MGEGNPTYENADELPDLPSGKTIANDNQGFSL